MAALGSSPLAIRSRACAKCFSSSELRGPEDEVDGDEERASSADRAAEISLVLMMKCGQSKVGEDVIRGIARHSG